MRLDVRPIAPVTESGLTTRPSRRLDLPSLNPNGGRSSKQLGRGLGSTFPCRGEEPAARLDFGCYGLGWLR